MTEQLINSEELMYCFIRSDQWVSREYYPVVYALFRREIELNSKDTEVYNHIDNSSFNELKKNRNAGTGSEG